MSYSFYLFYKENFEKMRNKKRHIKTIHTYMEFGAPTEEQSLYKACIFKIHHHSLQQTKSKAQKQKKQKNNKAKGCTDPEIP